MTSPSPEPLRLIGNPEENFYVLGKKHAPLYAELRERLLPSGASRAWRLLTRQPLPADEVTRPGGAVAGWLRAYCEGLDETVERHLAVLERLEASSLPGGLNAFRWNEVTQGPEHHSLSEWPLALFQGAATETIYLRVPRGPGMVYTCVPGVPFLPLAGMNDAGLTLALHRKFSPLFHASGAHAGPMALEALWENRNATDLRKFLRHRQTRRLWAFHACDPSGQVVVVDLAGPQLDARQYGLREEKLVVYNARTLVKSATGAQLSTAPAGFSLCQEKRDDARARLREVREEHPLRALTLAPASFPRHASAVGPATVQALSFFPGTLGLESSMGVPPLWFQARLLRWQDLFRQDMRQSETLLPPPDSTPGTIRAAWEDLGQAQRLMDLGDVPGAFHRFQMALARARPLGGLPTFAWAWPWWQWKHLEGKRDRLHLPALARETLASAPATYHPHLRLLLMLLEEELGLVATVAPPDLPAPFREWADLYLRALTSERKAQRERLEARLDLMDLAPLDGSWTKGMPAG